MSKYVCNHCGSKIERNGMSVNVTVNQLCPQKDLDTMTVTKQFSHDCPTTCACVPNCYRLHLTNDNLIAFILEMTH